ncbi:alpha/beta hydrolase [Pseudoroseomonas rhizosphaerae]|uniref:Alpha/beta hydrolase n=1 Tax=Teichococcus rhizosphaerae TaxID=1335062 RepID=A0A2C7A5Z4_9PROT|nr:alpha/beta hydrolase [Pseudoroseomonas rhizosphaerae]PHK95518.1 alpha/beta hydrolase [Pseudoroseomonas rhizosphaerae]
MPLDPGAQRVLDLMRETGRPPMHSLAPAEARAVFTGSRAVLQPEPAPVALVEDLTCPGPAGEIRLRHYRGQGTGTGGTETGGTGAGAALPCLLYLHGGGWVVGDLDSHDQPCRALANLTGASVIAVDYRLAPEHPFPAAVEDAAAALRFVHAEAGRLGIDPARIAVGGDSAGGNLAAVLCLMARDGTLPAPGFQLLLYPVTDLGANTASYGRVTEGYPLTATTMRWFIDHYVAEPAQRHDWRASPLRAASLAGVAPAFVSTAGHDPLADEGIAYARRLDREGVRVAHLHLADQMHGYLTMGRFIPAAALTLRQAAAALRTHWGMDQD